MKKPLPTSSPQANLLGHFSHRDFRWSPLPDSKGQTLIEFVLIAIISFALIFGIMDLARLAWTMSHLNGAAFAAARAAAVNKNPMIAANYVTMGTLGSPCVVTTRKSSITSKNPGFTVSPIRKEDLNLRAATATVTYYYKPLFAYGAWKYGIPIRVSSRISTEIPEPIPTSR